MKFILEFLRQKVPKQGREMPVYFRRALVSCEWIMAVYLLVSFFLIEVFAHKWTIMPLFLCAGLVACVLNVDRIRVRMNLVLYALTTLVWCGWYINAFGWGIAGQHVLVPLLVLAFFDIYEPPLLKLAYFLLLVLVRMGLFYYALRHPATFEVTQTANIVFQMFNSFTYFVILAVLCISFSSSMQDTERQLRIDNQELHREAGTDPLTRLPNRRAMIDELDLYRRSSPDESFCVAIADIDFFKHVNDTYGHNCGDYTLRALADLFRENAGLKYRVCRWGGEEFCFFFPGMNLDEAGREMLDLNVAVGHMPLSFEGNDFSITITIGVEENDFKSPMESILERADQKLYMGKNSGRNQVVI